MSVLRAELGEAQMETVIRSGLHEYLDGLQTKMNAIGDSLNQDFFVAPARRTDGPAAARVNGRSLRVRRMRPLKVTGW